MAVWQKLHQFENVTGDDLGAVIDLFHEGMLAVGCVQTADTGQVSSEGLPDPVPTTAFNLGFRTYELNDSLSSTYPVIIRADFKSQRFTTSTAVHAPSIRISVGFETNGAGTLVGSFLDLGDPWGANTTSGAPVATAPALSIACWLDGYLCMVLGVGAYANLSASITPALFSLCRTHGLDGKPDGRGVILFSPVNNASNLSGQEMLYVGGVLRSSGGGASRRDPIPVGSMRSYNGVMVAHSWDTRVIDVIPAPPYLIAIPQEYNTGAILNLGLDGWGTNPYFPIPTARQNVTGEAANRLVTTVNRQLYNFPNGWNLAMRYE